MKLLNLVNSTNQSVLAGGTVNLGSVIHRVCNGTFNFTNSNTIALNNQGWYKVHVTINATGTAVGVNTFQLYQNGAAVSGALASHTIAAIDDVRNFSFETIIRVLPSCSCQCNTPVNLTILNNGDNTITVNNITVDVVKVN